MKWVDKVFGGCFVAGTLVLMDGEQKPIEEVEPGESVRVPEAQSEEPSWLHLRLATTESEKTGQVEKVRADQVVLTRDRGWQRADALEVGEYLFTAHQGWLRLEELEGLQEYDRTKKSLNEESKR